MMEEKKYIFDKELSLPEEPFKYNVRRKFTTRKEADDAMIEDLKYSFICPEDAKEIVPMAIGMIKNREDNERATAINLNTPAGPSLFWTGPSNKCCSDERFLEDGYIEEE